MDKYRVKGAVAELQSCVYKFQTIDDFDITTSIDDAIETASEALSVIAYEINTTHFTTDSTAPGVK